MISKVKFQGNKHVSGSQLKDEIAIEGSTWFKRKLIGKEPVYYSRTLYNEDITRLRVFYQKEGYLNVQFDEPEIVITKKDRLELTIFIREGKPITISDISYNVDSTNKLDNVLQPKDKRKLLLQTQINPTKIFRDEAVINDKQLIAETFFDYGYPYTAVEHQLDVDTATNTTSVNWNIVRGKMAYIGKTTITGNERVPSKSILRQVAYEEGEVWSKKKIDQTQKQIYGQGNYRVASIRTKMGEEQADTIPLQIYIREAPRWSVRFGAGYGREDKLRAYTDVQYLGFLTNTGRLNLYAKHSGLEPYNVYLKFSQPSFIVPINTLTIHPFILEQDEPGYKLQKMGASLTFLQNFSKELNTSIGLIYEDVEQDTSVYFGESSDLYDESIYSKMGVVLGAIYNNSDPILDPVQGYSVSFNIKTNDIMFAGNIPFYRILTEYKTYFGIHHGVVLALKGKIGGIKRTDNADFIPVEEKFFAGGSHSVRGWSRGNLGPHNEYGTPVGGNSLLEATTEFRFDLGRRMKFNVFIDGGNVWQKSFEYHITDLHYSAGAGLRIKTPMGPAGIDFARPVFDSDTKWQIHFNIGHSF
ncbi:BamA/TamA family outer membrane protein [Draconibacterium sp. IB214405]|uniref:BamA/OMP85 family outer membrane protein n=1 Tax=Draconibacterium sp. IB214405 TaxID=3097352 RepID=UPI002A0BE210|nr:BamA/TamA family outer membrane protein [Draconibacterium sp. IB214405]MDX8337980.1 BamA/TamA family outer membrane protein [Draconibacterium sp. IB214405]